MPPATIAPSVPIATEIPTKPAVSGTLTMLDWSGYELPEFWSDFALKAAPSDVTLYDRNGNSVMPLGGNRCFFGPGSDCLNIIDHRDGKRRKALMADVEDGVILCDALKNIDFVMSMVLPSDVDQTLADIHQMLMMLSLTTNRYYCHWGSGGGF
jgi:trimethylamine--corrinoid protein Co-methyltransferase